MCTIMVRLWYHAIIVQHVKPDRDGQRVENWVWGGGVKKIWAKFAQARTTIPGTTPQGAKVQYQEKESTIPHKKGTTGEWQGFFSKKKI